MNLEQKVDAIEGEMTLMKGEIKKTLVDLREFVMKQGSPFAGGPDGAAGSPAISRDDVQRMVEKAQESAREESNEDLRKEIREIRKQSRAQLELQAANASHSDAAASASLQKEIDEFRRQSQEQIEALQVQQATWSDPSQAPDAPGPQVVQMPGQVQAPPQELEKPQVPNNQEPQAAPQPKVVQVQGPSVRPAKGPSDVQQNAGHPPPAMQFAPGINGPVVIAGPAERETNGARALAEQLQESASLDANLLASLLRWVGGMKRRLGGSQVAGFLEMYKLAGHLPPRGGEAHSPHGVAIRASRRIVGPNIHPGRRYGLASAAARHHLRSGACRDVVVAGPAGGTGLGGVVPERTAGEWIR